MTVTVVIAEANEGERSGLIRLILDQSNFEIVGQAGNIDEAAILVQALKPDVLSLSTDLPGLTDSDATGGFFVRSPKTRLLLLGAKDQLRTRRELSPHADGYLPRKAASQELIRTIRSVVVGSRYM